MTQSTAPILDPTAPILQDKAVTDRWAALEKRVPADQDLPGVLVDPIRPAFFSDPHSHSVANTNARFPFGLKHAPTDTVGGTRISTNFGALNLIIA